MSKKNDDESIDEMHKQLRDLLNNKSAQVAFAPFMESMKAGSQDPGDDEEQTPVPDLNRPPSLPVTKGLKRFAVSIANPRRFEIISIAL